MQIDNSKFTWFSKDPPIYVFDGDLWFCERTKDYYRMSIIRHAFMPLNENLEPIYFTKKNQILQNREIDTKKENQS